MEICDGWKERILFMLFLCDKRKETLAIIQIVFELSWGIFMLLSWRLFFLKGFLVNWHQFKILNRHISLQIYIYLRGVLWTVWKCMTDDHDMRLKELEATSLWNRFQLIFSKNSNKRAYYFKMLFKNRD